MHIINFERAASDLFFGERVFAPRGGATLRRRFTVTKNIRPDSSSRRARDIAVF